MSDLLYQQEPDLTASEFVDLLIRSTLGARRPLDEKETIEGMLRNASLILTCRTKKGLLVGISRAITDFHYCTYLSDLAVDTAFQKQGVGKKLIELTHESAGIKTMLILLSAPAAETYYPHIGMTKHNSAWMIPRVKA